MTIFFHKIRLTLRLSAIFLQTATTIAAIAWPLGCSSVDERIRTTQSEFDSGDLANAALHFQELCESNAIVACERLSSMYEHGQGVPHDKSRATELAKKALRLSVVGCSEGSARDCERVGLALISVKNADIHIVDPDLIRSYCQTSANACDSDVSGVKLLLRACDSRIGSACNTAGALISAGRGEKKDLSKARSLYSQACELDYGLGCYNLAPLYRNGWTVQQDFSTAVRLFQKACNLKESFACFDLARILVDGGPGVPKDPRQAVSILQKLCDENEGYGCHALGRILISGQGVPADRDRAVALYKKACDLKLKKGCIDWNVARNE